MYNVEGPVTVSGTGAPAMAAFATRMAVVDSPTIPSDLRILSTLVRCRRSKHWVYGSVLDLRASERVRSALEAGDALGEDKWARRERLEQIDPRVHPVRLLRQLAAQILNAQDHLGHRTNKVVTYA